MKNNNPGTRNYKKRWNSKKEKNLGLWLIKLLIKNKLGNTLIKPSKIKIYWEFIMKTPKRRNCEDKKVII